MRARRKCLEILFALHVAVYFSPLASATIGEIMLKRFLTVPTFNNAPTKLAPSPTQGRIWWKQKSNKKQPKAEEEKRRKAAAMVAKNRSKMILDIVSKINPRNSQEEEDDFSQYNNIRIMKKEEPTIRILRKRAVRRNNRSVLKGTDVRIMKRSELTAREWLQQFVDK